MKKIIPILFICMCLFCACSKTTVTVYKTNENETSNSTNVTEEEVINSSTAEKENQIDVKAQEKEPYLGKWKCIDDKSKYISYIEFQLNGKFKASTDRPDGYCWNEDSHSYFTNLDDEYSNNIDIYSNFYGGDIYYYSMPDNDTLLLYSNGKDIEKTPENYIKKYVRVN